MKQLLELNINNKTIGTLEYKTAADEAEIIDIKIDAAFRRQGYGTKLLINFINQLSPEIKKIFLEVRKSNVAAITLYTKIGFEVFGERKEYYSNPKEDAVNMQLAI